MNNAGVLQYSTFLGAPNLDAARLEMQTNYPEIQKFWNPAVSGNA